MIDLIGIAGSGKTTQGQLLAKHLKIPWISTGHLLREHADGKVQKELLEGKIINDDTTLGLLEKELKEKHTDQTEFVLDGSPRSLNQAKWLVKKIKSGRMGITAFVHLEMDPALARQRLLQRGRHDDKETAIAERFHEYTTTILPILNYLEDQKMPLFHINGRGSIKEVEARIREVLKV